MKKIKEIAHEIYLCGVDENPYDAEDLTKELLKELKRERQAMAKALRMKEEDGWARRGMSSNSFTIGWNQAVQRFNKKIDTYLKGKK